MKPQQSLYCDGSAVYFCDQNWKRLKTLTAEALPEWFNGRNTIHVQCEFDGDSPPKLALGFRSRSAPQTLTAE